MSTVAILILGVGVVLVLPLAGRIAQRRFDPFEPIFVFALAWGVMFVVRPTAMLIRDDFVFFGVNISETLDEAVFLALLGAVAFVVGYEASLGKKLAARVPYRRPVWSVPRALAGASIAGALGIVSLAVFLLWTGGLPAIRTFLGGRSAELDELLRDSPLFLWWLSLLVVPAALVAFAVALRQREAGAVGVAAVLTGLALLRTVPTGSRLYVLMLVGGMIVLVYLHRSRRPGLVAVVVGLVVALAASYTFLFFRYADTRESFPAAVKGLGSTQGRVFAPVLWGADAEMAPALAGALRAIPGELGYRYGRATLGDLAVRPVPRVLWSGKPEPHTLEVTGSVWPEARRLGNFQPAFTPLLSFFWDFGMLGVLLGMALYGVLARSAYEYLLRALGDPRTQVLYAAALWTLVVALRFDPVLLVVHSVVVFGPLVAIGALSSAGRPARS